MVRCNPYRTCFVLPVLCLLAGCGADRMRTQEVQRDSFIVLRSGDIYLEAEGDCLQVYPETDAGIPGMTDGDFARVCADVRICEGGEAGFRGNRFIRELHSCEILPPETVWEQCGIPETGSAADPGTGLSMYRDGTDLYCVLVYQGSCRLYRNGAFVGESETLPD